MTTRTTTRGPHHAGITLVEIMISIMILGIGLVSLATLFPIGLLRLRDAQRQTRSAYLLESAASDMAARGLLTSQSFTYADLINYQYSQAPFNFPFPLWYVTATAPTVPGGYNPLTHDAGTYGPFITYVPSNPDPNAGIGDFGPLSASGGYGLPFAYDPLWRYQTVYNGVPGGLYLDPVGLTTPEARFGSGIYALRGESDGFPASAHGLQRLTNFNRAYWPNPNNPNVPVPIMPSAAGIPDAFVSPEDFVWQEGTNLNYVLASDGTTPVGTPSTVLPDMSLSSNSFLVGANTVTIPSSIHDWRFSWMVTVQQVNGSNGSAFEGNIVVFENRPFSISQVQGPTNYVVDGETVVEAIFGFSTHVVATGIPGQGYGAGADRTVLLRWNSSNANLPIQPDPVVRTGDWIADVTYERNQNQVNSRFFNNNTANPQIGVPNPLNNGEWDNLPAQRCFWYQIQKVGPATSDPYLAGYRSMVVYVNQKLQAKTLLSGTAGVPVYQNAALICPYVVNVIPQTFFVR